VGDAHGFKHYRYILPARGHGGLSLENAVEGLDVIL